MSHPLDVIKLQLNNASILENGKVTKTNFFSVNSNARTQDDEEQVDLNESMISGNVDPDKWYDELERVKKDLTLVEKDQSKLDLDALEEHTNHINDIIYHAKLIQNKTSDEYELKKK